MIFPKYCCDSRTNKPKKDIEYANITNFNDFKRQKNNNDKIYSTKFNTFDYFKNIKNCFPPKINKCSFCHNFILNYDYIYFDNRSAKIFFFCNNSCKHKFKKKKNILKNKIKILL